MSYCAIIPFIDGKPQTPVQYKNSWGGAAHIWTALYDKYISNRQPGGWLCGDTDALWELANRQDLPVVERAVHAATFDYAIIKKENYKRFAEDLRTFIAKYPVSREDQICHLPAWADFIESCEAEAIGFHGTSVSNNLWECFDSEKDEYVSYDLNKETKHFEVYEELNKELKD